MKMHWPEINIPEGFNDAESYLRHLVYQQAKNHGDGSANPFYQSYSEA